MSRPRIVTPAGAERAAGTHAVLARVLAAQPAALLIALLLVGFAAFEPRTLSPGNLLNILVQSASVGLVAAGMTFVLVTGGIDLSVGAVMLVSAAIAGKLVLAGQPLWLALVATLSVGAGFGALNAAAVTRLGVPPFIVTLATLYMGRGFGLWLTETRALNLPDTLLQLGASRVLGVPLPAVVLVAGVALAHLVLERTAFGRHALAVGHDPESARRAGLHVTKVLAVAYVVSGVMAALGGAVAVAQLGAVSPTFGRDRELSAVAAAVLGGVSLFGGQGRILPGALLGALLVQTVENGLVLVNADPYVYPMALAAVLFAALVLPRLRGGSAGSRAL